MNIRAYTTGRFAQPILWLALLFEANCRDVLDLDHYRVEPRIASSTARSDAGSDNCAEVDPCIQPVTERCPLVYGAARDRRSLRLGAVIELSGPQAQAGIFQARSAELAIIEINNTGGVLLPGNIRRPVMLIVCDGALGTDQAVSSLIEQLEVKAVIGPAVAARREVLVLSPDALSNDALPNRVVSMVPSQEQRVPMLMAELQALSVQRNAEHMGNVVKLALVVRSDTPATSLQLSRDRIVLNMPPAIATKLDVRVYEHAGSTLELSGIADQLAREAPDIIVADGATAIVTQLIEPLERALALDASAHKPHYLLSDAAQVPELLTLVARGSSLQQRVNIVGVVPGRTVGPVYESYAQAYTKRYGRGPRGMYGTAATYTATYTLAYLLAAAENVGSAPAALLPGLQWLNGGGLAASLGPSDFSMVTRALLEHRTLSLAGPLSTLDWNQSGSPRTGSVGRYCVALVQGTWSFVRAPFVYDVASERLIGQAVECSALLNVTGAPRVSSITTDKTTSSSIDAGTSTTAATNTPNMMDSSVTATRDAGQNVPTDDGIVVQYHALNIDPHDNVIASAFKIINRSASRQKLRSLTLRYYFSNETPGACPDDCTLIAVYPGLPPSAAPDLPNPSYHTAKLKGSNAYLEIAFPDSAVQLKAGQSVEVQQIFQTDENTKLDESDDYSFRATPADFADWDHVTLYKEDRLIWGTPPADQ